MGSPTRDSSEQRTGDEAVKIQGEKDRDIQNQVYYRFFQVSKEERCSSSYLGTNGGNCKDTAPSSRMITMYYSSSFLNITNNNRKRCARRIPRKGPELEMVKYL